MAERSEIIETHPDVNWHVAMTPGKRKALDKDSLVGELTDALEKTKASIRAKVKHPFWVVKRLWGHAKVRYRGLAKNTAQFTMQMQQAWVRLRHGPEPLNEHDTE